MRHQLAPLHGVYAPIVTPFDDATGAIDFATYARVIESLLASGISGLVVAGTTGEGYALSPDERMQLLAFTRDVCGTHIPLLAGVGGMATTAAIEHARMAQDATFDGLMIAAPAYCLPTQIELADHIRAILNACPMPAVLYDYPQRTGVSFEMESLDHLAQDPRIIGIKEASGDFERVALIQTRFGDSLPVVCGADADVPVFLERGVTCWIGGIANLLPTAHVAIMNGDAAAYAAVRPTLALIESGQYIAHIKAGMGMRNCDVGAPRAPLDPLDETARRALAHELDAAGAWAPNLI
jgi:4-hydroxy-tetrahydrodipicolinate synthase